MARKKAKLEEPEEIERDEPEATEELREERDSFKGADPAFAEMHRIAEPATPHQKLHSKILDYLEEFRKATINIVFAGIVFLLVLTIFRVIYIDELVVDPISLPKPIKELGYTEEGVALTLSDKMFKIFNEVKLTQHDFNVKAKIEEADFAVPVAGLSFSSAIRLVRQIAGFPQRHIAGEIICPQEPCTTKSMQLHIRFMDGINPPQVVEHVEAENAEALLDLGAEKLLKITDPLTLAVYLYSEGDASHPRRQEALDIAMTKIDDIGRTRATAMNLLGSAILDNPARSEDEFKLAVGYFSMAAEADPTYYPAHANLGEAFTIKGLYGAAIESIDKAIKIVPQLSSLFVKRGRANFESGEFAQALKDFQNAEKLDETDAFAKNGIGAVLNEQLEYANAAKVLEAAIEINPKFTLAYLNLGNAYEKLNDKVKAKAAFESAIASATAEEIEYKSLAEERRKALE
jgi:Tfp pilus assembly protein PilF